MLIWRWTLTQTYNFGAIPLAGKGIAMRLITAILTGMVLPIYALALDRQGVV